MVTFFLKFFRFFFFDEKKKKKRTKTHTFFHPIFFFSELVKYHINDFRKESIFTTNFYLIFICRLTKSIVLIKQFSNSPFYWTYSLQHRKKLKTINLLCAIHSILLPLNQTELSSWTIIGTLIVEEHLFEIFFVYFISYTWVKEFFFIVFYVFSFYNDILQIVWNRQKHVSIVFLLSLLF